MQSEMLDNGTRWITPYLQSTACNDRQNVPPSGRSNCCFKTHIVFSVFWACESACLLQIAALHLPVISLPLSRASWSISIWMLSVCRLNCPCALPFAAWLLAAYGWPLSLAVSDCHHAACHLLHYALNLAACWLAALPFAALPLAVSRKSPCRLFLIVLPFLFCWCMTSRCLRLDAFSEFAWRIVACYLLLIALPLATCRLLFGALSPVILPFAAWLIHAFICRLLLNSLMLAACHVLSCSVTLATCCYPWPLTACRFDAQPQAVLPLSAWRHAFCWYILYHKQLASFLLTVYRSLLATCRVFGIAAGMLVV